MSNESFNHGANRTVAGREMDVDDFLGHRSRERSSNLVLRSSEWKKDGKIDLWLHTKTRIASVWRHSFWRVVEREDKETRRKERVVVFSPWNCHEDEQVLKRQYKRRADGTRVVPPEQCPFDKLAEEVRRMAIRREILWTDPVLKFEGDDKSQAVIVRAGDFWNAFGSKDLSEEEIGQVRKAGAPAKRDAWKTALLAKCSYLFVAVDDSDLAAGARILIEGEAVGRGMQKTISEKMEEAYELKKNKDFGNPFKHPYLFRWTYDDAKEFSEKYGVKAFAKQPSDEVLAIIRDAEPPDTSDELAFGDSDELRALLEAHALVKLPLDACFPARDPVAAQQKGEAPAPAVDEQRFDCDHCGEKEVMTIDDMACPKCGANYGQMPDNDGVSTVLFTRPCTSCKAQIPLPGTGAPGTFGEHAKCGQCGAEHFEDKMTVDGKESVVWTYVEASKREPAKEEPKPAARRARR